MANKSLSSILRSDRDTVRLYLHLSSLDRYMESMDTLLRCADLTAAKFRRYGRKLIALAEAACKAAAAEMEEGFDASSVNAQTDHLDRLGPYISRYFQLLRVIESRRLDFEHSLQERVAALLSVLYLDGRPPQEARSVLYKTVLRRNAPVTRGRPPRPRIWGGPPPALQPGLTPPARAPNSYSRPQRRFGIFCTGKQRLGVSSKPARLSGPVDCDGPSRAASS